MKGINLSPLAFIIKIDVNPFRVYDFLFLEFIIISITIILLSISFFFIPDTIIKSIVIFIITLLFFLSLTIFMQINTEAIILNQAEQDLRLELEKLLFSQIIFIDLLYITNCVFFFIDLILFLMETLIQ